MRLTRREALAGAAAGVLGAAGIYEVVDRLGSSPSRPRVTALPPEQHVLDGIAIVKQEGVEVVVPPLHHTLVTATVKATDLRDAQRRLQQALDELDASYEPTPAGLGVTVAWGLPYFRRYVPRAAERHLPFDRRAGKPVLLDAVRFPSDPHETILESNDVAVLLRSDRLDHIAHAEHALFEVLPVFERTSVRRGFAGGGFEGRTSLPKKLAMAAGVPGADLIPDTAELFLGFTSTQKQNLGPRKIANHETLGYVDLRGGYFHGGTHMHVSHIAEDLEAWYLNFDFRERADTTFRPAVKIREGAQVVPQGPRDASDEARVARDFKTSGRFGHSASIQPTSRLQHDVVGPDGTVYTKGTAVPQRADFNTLDNPFAWTAHRARDQWSDQPSAGVHFVVFNPTGDDFHRNRMAMDGIMPGGVKLALPPRSRSQGFNAVLRTTHRQNYLVPPRRHRAFPLAELEDA